MGAGSSGQTNHQNDRRQSEQVVHRSLDLLQFIIVFIEPAIPRRDM
jgi:hypothetical protein